MASLGGQTVASSFDRLLTLPAGGGDGTNLVSLTDGNEGTTFALKISDSDISLPGIGKLYLDGGSDTYIYQSSDNTVEVVAGATTLLYIDNQGGGGENEVRIPTDTKLRIGGADTYFIENPDDNLQLYVGSREMMLWDQDVEAGGYGTISVGIDGEGCDFKLFGETASTGYMHWDQSRDDLILGTSSRMGIATITPETFLHIHAGNTAMNLNSDVFNTSNILLSRSISGEAAHWENKPLGCISFQGAGNAGSEGEKLATFAALQTSTDEDQIGFAWYTSEGTGGSDQTLSAGMVLTHDSRVGIGYNVYSPAAQVEIQGNTKLGAFDGTNPGPGSQIIPYGILALTTSHTSISSGNRLGMIAFSSPLEDNTADARLPGAAIWAEAMGSFSETYNKADIVFASASTEDARLAAAEQFRITSTRSVFKSTLEVGASGGSNGQDFQCFGTTSGSYFLWNESEDYAEIDIGTQDGTALRFTSANNSSKDIVWHEGGTTKGRIRHHNDTSGTDALDRLELGTATDLDAVVIAGGNVGIATTSPNATLHVAGSFAASGPSETFVDWADVDSTPDVSTANIFRSGEATETIDNFDTAAGTPGGIAGQKITIYIRAAITFDYNAGNIRCGSGDLVTAAGDVVEFTYFPTAWFLTCWYDATAVPGNADDGF